ncbi:cupredoxin domain-containing protein [Virgibacillus sp. M23]|uniref:cupredoxin domain-containing protein n=1 Tax=Virgibacillus sp. M23 TaxID=3079030 RepID=UPI002A911544|nr:cupredoxin domain-containing protein [Virgibacillus sp. M23]MDY7042960.1 cupredoxin domain-containing protein [Virgibacillus sp. M23]
MTISMFVTILVIALLSAFIIWNTIYYRNKIAVMSGMMVAMALGMSAGLAIGVIIGAFLSGNLFDSTVIGILVGMATGYLAGMPISMMAVIDGALAGIMGGMMGAMLGDMIAAENQEAMIRIIVALFVGTVLILYYLIKQESTTKASGWFLHPLTLIVISSLFIMAYQQLGPVMPYSANDYNNSYSQLQEKHLQIEADEYTFLPNRATVAVGETINLVLANRGTMEHHLVIIGLKAQGTSSAHHQESNYSIQLHSDAGENQVTTFTPLIPGTYRYICTIPGHKEAGMEGEIEVTL